MRRLRDVPLSAALVISTCSAIVFADPSGSAFLRMDPSARSQALGTSSDVTSIGAQAPGANPANLMVGRPVEVFTSYSLLTNDLSFTHAGASGIFKENWGVGVFVSRFSYGEFERRDIAGNLGGTFTAGDIAFGASLARNIHRNLSLGVTLKGLRSEIDSYATGVNWAVDTGFLYRRTLDRWPVELGGSVRNLGPSVSFIDDADPLPTTLSASLALTMHEWKPVLTVRRLIPDQLFDYGFGLEYNHNILSGRVGYVFEGGASNLAAASSGAGIGLIQGFSTGIGVHFNSFTLDYTLMTPTADLGLFHRAALTVHFGGSE